MRAVIFREHSPSLDVYELVDDMPIPEIGPTDVLVRVAYGALNRLDDFVRRGWKGLDLALPHIPGSDFSGTIAQVGDGVRGWAIGQAVTANTMMWCGTCAACIRGKHNQCTTGHILGEHIPGGYAEYVRVPARNLIAVPDGYDMGKAAAASLVYVTAWQNLMVAGRLTPGERVLIVGAGGGVNTAAIQIAKMLGCTVYVIAGDGEKAEKARELGADWVHDRSQEPAWGKPLFNATGRLGVNMAVDNVGEATWANSLRALSPGGRLVTVGGTSGYGAAVPVNLIFARHLSIIGSTMGTQSDYETVMGLVFAGKLDPVVDSVYPLADYRSALEHMLGAGQFGKILVEVG
jgi:NADPH:quinone reductase-like Zn-dependent oxidoreductase